MKKIIFITILVTLFSCHARKEKSEISNTNSTNMDSIKKITMKTDSINNIKEKRKIVFKVMNTTKVTSEFEQLDIGFTNVWKQARQMVGVINTERVWIPELIM